MGIYMDNAATTPVDPRVTAAMLPFLEATFGNPSSLHRAGREAHEAIDRARKQSGGQIDYFVCGVGTGGTISGTGRYLKERNPAVRVAGVDPKGSVLGEYFYTKQYRPALKTYKVEGIGQDWLPGTLDFGVIDDMVEVTDEEAFIMARRLTREEGIFAGGSAGAAVAAALKYAEGRMSDENLMVVLLPDSGERYLSKIYNDEWMAESGFLGRALVPAGSTSG